MTDYIVTDENGDVVAKYRQNRPPKVPDEFDLKEVSDVSAHNIDTEVGWFPDSA